MNKKILLILAIFIFIELVWAKFYLTKKGPTQSPTTQEKTATQTRPDTSINFSLSPDQQIIKINQPFEVKLIINTQNKSASAADAIILYDPNFLKTSQKDITVGTIFPSYLLVKNDPEKGKITIMGTTTDPAQTPFSGKGVFATIKFTPTKVGQTNLSYEFTKGSTADSNIVSSKTVKDILEKTKSATYTIID